MRTLLAPLVFCWVAACSLAGCSKSSEEASAPDLSNSAAAAPSAGRHPEAQASAVADADAKGAGAISFNAAQTADSDAWYTAAEGSTACTVTSSPAQAIERLQGMGITPTTTDTNAADGSLAEVVIRWSDERGPASTTYYRKLGDCEATLPSPQSVPDRYK